MNKKIIVNGTEYKMAKMSADTYMDYLDLAEQTDKSHNNGRYTRQDIEAITLFICKIYGNQFTPEELKDVENGGLDITGIIFEFQFLDAVIAEEFEERAEKIQKNFTKGK